MNLLERAVSPTPTFFQKLRNIGLALAAISAAIIASPVALPAIVVTIAELSRCCGNRAECGESGHHSGRQVTPRKMLCCPRLCKRRRGFFTLFIPPGFI